MTRISSKLTFVFKRAFPVLWFGSLAICFCVGVGLAVVQQRLGETAVVMIAGSPFMAIFGYIVMKFMIFDLVDEVWDRGDSLVVRNNGQEISVPLSDCLNVNSNAMMNPPRVTLLLRLPTIFGEDVSFIPTFRWIPYLMHPIAQELILRIDAAKHRSSPHNQQVIDTSPGEA